MKISYAWLKEFIDLPPSPYELVSLLNRLGLMVEKVEEKEGDVILEVETYANRPDTLGHLGLAREISAALGVRLKEKSWPIREIPVPTSSLVKVEIIDQDLCRRYCGVIVRGVKVGPSPSWLRHRLEALGLRSINNVVDVTNYVLMATGHPIHAFDLAKLSGPAVFIRRAKKGERLRILGGEVIELSAENLVIADAEKPVALAGIIGGEDSAVTDQTSDVFLESAWFDPVSVHLTRKAKGLDTDASYRFERGADISFPPEAARIAASLLGEFGGQMTQGIIDVYPQPAKLKEVLLRLTQVKNLLGIEVEKGFVESLLAALGFVVQKQSASSFLVRVPPHRIDIEREADLVEEIARFYGYDRIPSCLPPFKVINKPVDRRRKQIQKIRDILFHQGFDEVLNFSFSDPEKEAKLRLELKPISLSNPLSSRSSFLRTSLLGGLLETIARNQKRGLEGVHIFEIGQVYFWEDDRPAEKLSLGLASTGWLEEPRWKGGGKKADFFHVKGTCELLLEELLFEPFFFRRAEHSFFMPDFCLCLEHKGDVVGYLGKIKPEILSLFDVEEDTFAAFMNLDLLLAKQPRSLSFVPVPRFPAVIRDISFILNSDIPYEEVRQKIERLEIPFLESLTLIDRFVDPKIGEGKVSLTLRLVYRHPNRTLLTEEVDRLDQKVISHLSSVFQAKLREGGKN